MPHYLSCIITPVDQRDEFRDWEGSEDTRGSKDGHDDGDDDDDEMFRGLVGRISGSSLTPRLTRKGPHLQGTLWSFTVSVISMIPFFGNTEWMNWGPVYTRSRYMGACNRRRYHQQKGITSAQSEAGSSQNMVGWKEKGAKKVTKDKQGKKHKKAEKEHIVNKDNARVIPEAKLDAYLRAAKAGKKEDQTIKKMSDISTEHASASSSSSWACARPPSRQKHG